MVNNFHHPTPSTTWSDSLTLAYKDELDKLDRYHNAARAADKSETEAELGIKPVTVGLQAVGALGKFSNLIDKENKKREKADEKEFGVAWSQIEQVDKETITDLLSKEDFLSKDSANIIDKLSKAGLQKETLTLLKRNSAGNSLKLRRLLGFETIVNEISSLDASLESSEGGALQGEYDLAKNRGDVAGFYKGKVVDKLNRLGFDTKYIAAHFQSEIDRVSTVKGALASLDYANVAFTAEGNTNLELIKNIDKDVLIVDGQIDQKALANNAANVFKEILGSYDGNKAKTATFLHRVLKSGEVPPAVIQLMKEGEVEGFAGGKTVGKFYDQKEWNYILSGATEFATNTWNTAVNKAEGQSVKMLGLLHSDKNPYTTQESWDLAIQPLEKFVSAKTWKLLTDQNQAAMSVDQEARYDSQWRGKERAGTLDLQIEDIKLIPNPKVRNKYLKPAEIVKAAKEDPQYSTAYNEEIIKRDVFAARSKQNFQLDKGHTISDGDLQVSQIITDFKRRDFTTRVLDQYKTGKFIENPNLIKDHLQAVADFKVLNDYGVENGKGRLALTGSAGDWKWGNVNREVTVSASYDHNAPLSSTAENDYNARAKGKTMPELLQSGLFNFDQIVSWRNGEGFSADMYYIRDRTGKPMSDIIEHSINALEAKATKDPILKKKLALLNLVEYGGSMPTPDRIVQRSLYQLLESSEGNEKLLASNLVAIFKWHGPEVLFNSPKISNQLWNALNNIPSPENVSQQAAEDTQAVETNYQTKIVPTLKSKLKAFTHSDGSQLYEDEAIEELLAERGRVTFKNGKIYIDGNEAFSLK